MLLKSWIYEILLVYIKSHADLWLHMKYQIGVIKIFKYKY